MYGTWYKYLEVHTRYLVKIKNRPVLNTRSTRNVREGGLSSQLGIWAAKKHAHVGTSSTHNEYMALYHLVRAIVWLRQLITEVGLDGELLDGPTLALGDNDQATNLCCDDVVTVGSTTSARRCTRRSK